MPAKADRHDREQAVTPLTTDTVLDKGVRFVCGVFLGSLIVLGLAEFGEILTDGGFLVAAGLFIMACGVIGVTNGERFFEGLLKAFAWFS